MAGNKKKGRITAADRRRKSSQKVSNQTKAIILFALSLFLLFVILIPGEKLWNYLHTLFFGIFGICTYILPAVLIYISIMLALDKMAGRVKIKLFEACVLIVLIGALLSIYFTKSDFFPDFIRLAFEQGKGIKGGGFLGALIGYPILYLFGSVGATITLVLLIFVDLMLILGITLLSLFKTAAKPIKNIQEKQLERRSLKSEPRFEIDVPLSDNRDQDKLQQNELNTKRKKLIEAYHNGNTVKKKQDETKADDNKHDENIEGKIEREIEKEIEKNKAAVQQPKSGTGVSIESITASYRFPPLSLLEQPKSINNQKIGDELRSNAQLLVNTLKSFGVDTRVINITRGPAVTRYELQPSAGVKISKITNLADDIALNLAASAVRIEAPIPNKSAVGIEVPNKSNSIVTMSQVLNSSSFISQKSKLTAALGQDITGSIAVADLAKMPHLLIAGATGSGKSVCINSIIVSLLYKSSPDEVKLLMIDPKVVELGIYNGIPHLLVPVVTDPRKAAGALGWAVNEMMKRYKIFAENNVRDVFTYNALCKKKSELERMPQVVIIIDELADLMMVAPNEVEDSICRLAQMARAAGMHLVIATQRPSVDVITGIIKANIPSRIAFAVSSQVDSRTILDMGGAEKLLGKGDMLYFPIGMSKPMRVQGCYVSDYEINGVVDFIKNSSNEAEYDQQIITEIEQQAVADKKSKKSDDDYDDMQDDAKLPDAIEVVVEAGSASTSLLQRRLKLGYARAARIIDTMEQKGIVGTFEGSKPRKVLITKQQWLEMKARGDQ